MPAAAGGLALRRFASPPRTRSRPARAVPEADWLPPGSAAAASSPRREPAELSRGRLAPGRAAGRRSALG
eukprot:1976083-Lingulodinium_polyedra.AAC.1